MRFWEIGKRNLKELYRDPLALAFLLAMPLAFILIFSFAFGGQTTRPISLGVVDEDQSQMSVAFAGALNSVPAFKVDFFEKQSEAEDKLNNGSLPVYLVISPGFAKAVERHEGINLALAYNEVDPTLPQRVMPIVMKATLDFLKIPLPLNIELHKREVEVKDEYLNFVIPGMAVFGLMILIPSVGGIMVRDRARGFLSRLLTTPARPTDFILGYTLPFVPVVLISILIYLGVGILLGLSVVGNFGLAFLILAIIGICCLGIGMIVGTMARSEEQASAAPYIFIVPIAMISGGWWPAEQMPSVIKSIAELLPFLHAMSATRDIVTRGADFTAVLPDLYWLVAWAVVLFVSGIVLFRQNMTN